MTMKPPTGSSEPTPLPVYRELISTATVYCLIATLLMCIFLCYAGLIVQDLGSPSTQQAIGVPIFTFPLNR